VVEKMIRETINKKSETLDYQEVIKEFERAERAQKERERSNGVMYVLDDPKIRDYVENFYENSLCDPEKEYIRKEAQVILNSALARLHKVQRRRIQKYFFEGKSKTAIAQEECARESAVRRSLARTFETLRPLLQGTGIAKSDFAVYTPTRYIKHRREAKILAQQYPCTTVYFLSEGGGQYE
jgi:DNA-directed RNA polymerase specialized sigma subunit